jgi:phosphoribosyl-AMP cyclohydrolase
MTSSSPKQLEEGTELCLDFEKLGHIARSGEAVLPVAVQDVDTKRVLIIAYANKQALEYTLEHKVATFWSTSRHELWIKGATTGDTLELVGAYVNCEQNSLLYLVRTVGNGACHTTGPDGKTRDTCFYREIVDGKLLKVSQGERGR